MSPEGCQFYRAAKAVREAKFSVLVGIPVEVGVLPDSESEDISATDLLVNRPTQSM
jgi:hypothetical protein